MSNTKQEKKILTRLDGWIEHNKNAMIEDIKTLVAVPSVAARGKKGQPFGAQCARVVDEAGKIIRRVGLKSKNWDYYGVSGELPGEKKEAIGFFSHLDVVPAGEGWTNDPYTAVEKNGWLIGRGVADNKGPCIADIYTLKFLKEMEVPLRHSFFCFLGANEESGMKDVEWITEKRKSIAFGLVTDAGFPVCHGEKGILQADFEFALPAGNLVSIEGGSAYNIVPDRAFALLKNITYEKARELLPGKYSVEKAGGLVKIGATGKGAHAAGPETSINAIRELASALLKAGLLRDAAVTIARFITDSFGDCHGEGLHIPGQDMSGKTTHILALSVPAKDRLILGINIRYIVSVAGAFLIKRLEEKAAFYGAVLKNVQDNPPLYIPAQDPVITELCAIAGAFPGCGGKPYLMGGGTYARKLPKGAAFGPGQAKVKFPKKGGPFGGAHQANEALRLKDIFDAVNIYVRAALALDKRERF
jgi:succinyl-diaminopimelate desuccinylase